MVFSDLFFLFVFIPAFALCYLLSSWFDIKFLAGGPRKTHRVRNATLVLFSLLFYAWGEPVYVFLMLLSVLMNYFVGLLVDRANGAGRKWSLALGIACNIAVIGVFKYADFIVEILNSCGLGLKAPHVALPIGISFYTFQSMSYLIDVYRRESPVQRKYADLLLYISMFPQLIAGPIVRYGTVAHELHNRRVSCDDVAEGIYRFLIGLGKKVLIANQIGEVATQLLSGGVNEMSVAGAWIGVTAFALQIYFDFSGYSDMAIGLGRCMGFHFNENFNHPYCCASITDFWRRWHMSLGLFFRDYVYIPLGGNRRHQPLNILVVWFLTGLWHGASWNFVLWGLYFGIIVAVEKFTVRKLTAPWWKPLLHAYSLVIVLIGWGLFYYVDMSHMGKFFAAMFAAGGTPLTDFTSTSTLYSHFSLWIAAMVLCLPLRTWLGRLSGWLLGDGAAAAVVVTTARIAVSLFILVLSVALLVGATNNAFLYTRF